MGAASSAPPPAGVGGAGGGSPFAFGAAAAEGFPFARWRRARANLGRVSARARFSAAAWPLVPVGSYHIRRRAVLGRLARIYADLAWPGPWLFRAISLLDRVWCARPPPQVTPEHESAVVLLSLKLCFTEDQAGVSLKVAFARILQPASSRGVPDWPRSTRAFWRTVRGFEAQVARWLNWRLAGPTAADLLDEVVAELVEATDPQRDRGDIAAAAVFAASANALAALVIIDQSAIADGGRSPAAVGTFP